MTDFNDDIQKEIVRKQREDAFRASVDYKPPSGPPAPVSLPQPVRMGPGSDFTACLLVPIHLLLLVPSLILYPIPVGGAVLVGGLTSWVAIKVFGAQGSWLAVVFGLVLPIALGWATLLALMAWDYRISKSAFWRLPRHLLRLLVFAAAIHWFIARRRAVSAGRVLDWQSLSSELHNPLRLAFLGACVLALHWVLTRAWLRELWHERMKALKLRPS